MTTQPQPPRDAPPPREVYQVTCRSASDRTRETVLAALLLSRYRSRWADPSGEEAP